MLFRSWVGVRAGREASGRSAYEAVQEGAQDEGQNHTATEDHHLLLDNIRHKDEEKWSGKEKNTIRKRH